MFYKKQKFYILKETYITNKSFYQEFVYESLTRRSVGKRTVRLKSTGPRVYVGISQKVVSKWTSYT